MENRDEAFNKAYQDNIKMIKSAAGRALKYLLKRNYNQIVQIDCNEIAAYAFWKAWLKYNPNHSSKTKFHTYFSKVIFREFIEESQKNVSNPYLYGKSSKECSITKHIEDKDENSYLMNSLNEDEKALIDMRFYQNLTLTDIGQRIGVTAETVRKRLEKIFSRLKTQLSGVI